MLVIIWSFTATALDDNAFPTPHAVWEAMGVEWHSGELFFHLGMTLLRVVAAFFVAMVIGSAIGIFLGLRPCLLYTLTLPTIYSV